MRGDVQQFAAADYVFNVVVTGPSVKIDVLKAKDGDLVLAPDDPRAASLRAAVERFIEGDAA